MAFFPFAHTKSHKLGQIIEHYAEEKATMENVINLQHYKLWIAKKNVQET
jgi:NADH:ubiquinone oxidoreductase subunit E